MRREARQNVCMKRVRPGVPILLVKSKIVSKTDRRPYWGYSANFFLPDDSYFSITYYTPQPPSKMNGEIWQDFAGSVRERKVSGFGR